MPSEFRIMEGDCTQLLPGLATASVDAIITDPPYPCIKRDYGTWTEEEWFTLMRQVVPECMRVLKPTGSAVFILQANSERLGRMRTWLWEFMLWVGREYGIVQDAYWFNHTTLPEAHSIQGRLMRPSVKAAVWIGQPDCYRDQDSGLWEESQRGVQLRLAERARGGKGQRRSKPSGHGTNDSTIGDAAERRGGVCPFNCYIADNTNSSTSSGSHGHGAGTPLALCRWWTRYICPPGGTILDPFAGAGTQALACLEEGRNFIGMELIPEYVRIIHQRLADERASMPLFNYQPEG